jgi:linear primary-alkylsulfatase
VVFADPENEAAKYLLADTYEQMGYQAESGPWRSVYLQGAFELRKGVPTAGGTVTASADTMRAMTPELLFDFLAVRLNGEKAAGRSLALNLRFTDLKKDYSLRVENGVLNYEPKLNRDAAANLELSKATLDRVLLGELEIEAAVTSGAVKVTGKDGAFRELLGMLDKFEFWFNIVTP